MLINSQIPAHLFLTSRNIKLSLLFDYVCHSEIVLRERLRRQEEGGSGYGWVRVYKQGKATPFAVPHVPAIGLKLGTQSRTPMWLADSVT